MTVGWVSVVVQTRIFPFAQTGSPSALTIPFVLPSKHSPVGHFFLSFRDEIKRLFIQKSNSKSSKYKEIQKVLQKLFLVYFAEEGVVQCVHTVVQGDTYYTSVFNPGLVDESSFHRFSCLVIYWFYLY